jgi:hypothetical protein
MGVKLGLLQEGKYARETENTVLRNTSEPKKQEIIKSGDNCVVKCSRFFNGNDRDVAGVRDCTKEPQQD